MEFRHESSFQMAKKNCQEASWHKIDTTVEMSHESRVGWRMKWLAGSEGAKVHHGREGKSEEKDGIIGIKIVLCYVESQLIGNSNENLYLVPWLKDRKVKEASERDRRR